MDKRLNMPLDDIIDENQKKKNNRLNNRNQRSQKLSVRPGSRNQSSELRNNSAPYNLRKSKSNPVKATHTPGQLAIKFLLPNSMVGSLIGPGGSSIKELKEIAGSNVYVSSAGLTYPGTDFRVVYITGDEASVTTTINLVFEMLGFQTVSNGTKEWNTEFAASNPGQNDKVEIEAKIAIPALMAGQILGLKGSTIKSISEVCGVNLAMDSKEDGDHTSERVISMSGTVASCKQSCALILAKLGEIEGGFDYVVNGTGYPKSIEMKMSNSNNETINYGYDLNKKSHNSNMETDAEGKLPPEDYSTTNHCYCYANK